MRQKFRFFIKESDFDQAIVGFGDDLDLRLILTCALLALVNESDREGDRSSRGRAFGDYLDFRDDLQAFGSSTPAPIAVAMKPGRRVRGNMATTQALMTLRKPGM